MRTYQLANQCYPEHGFGSAGSEIGEDIARTSLVRRGESRKNRYKRSDDLRYDEDKDEMESIVC